MTNEKKVFSASDSAPVVLYAKTDPASELAYPVVANPDGSINVLVTSGTITLDNLSIEQVTGVAHNTYNIAVAGMDTAGNVRPIKTDTTGQPNINVVNDVVVIDFAHQEIHDGDSFTCHYSQTAPTNIGDMTMVAFNTPNTTKYIHMLAEWSSTAASTAAIYEVADLDVDEGTDLAIYNRDRNSATASTVSTIETVPEAGKATSYTVAQAAGATLSTATPIYLKYLGAAAAGADTGGEQRDSNEFILKRNTQYAFVITNTTADDNTHNIVLNWYEHTFQEAL